MKILTVLLFLCTIVSCQSTYYKAWELLGKEKRDLLSSKVESAKDAQKDSKEEVVEILDKLRDKYGFDGGESEKLYRSLKADYEDATDSRDRLLNRSNDVRTIAKDLFEEWDREARAFKNKNYRRDSLRKLNKAKAQFKVLSDRMKQSEKQLDQVLIVLNDQVTYLKHNLNAKSLAVFDKEFAKVELEIKKLISKIEASLASTNDFQITLD